MHSPTVSALLAALLAAACHASQLREFADDTVLLQVTARGAVRNSTRQPHIIFILADDLGWYDVGFRNGGETHTPNIDKLARKGLVLDQFYVQSVCSPSRATFLTGRDPLRHRITNFLRPGEAKALPLGETLLPEVLKRAGYRTHMAGKWHLGYTKWAHTPTFRGFDSFVGFYGGGQTYHGHTQMDRYDFRREMQPRCGPGCSQLAWQDKGRYSTHILTEEAVRVVQRHDPAQAPLFLYLAYQAVHDPGEVPDSYRGAYDATISDPQRRTFAGMVSCMDEGIGNLTQALEAKGMLQDSVIFFSTDNGGATRDTPGSDYAGSRNYPLRGGKHSIWEGGTRGVAVTWAGRRTGLISAARRGTTVSALLHASDLLPTLCSVAGAKAHCDQLALDGFDQGPPLFQNASGVRTEVFYANHGEQTQSVHPVYDTAVRDADGWKLLQSWGGTPNSWSQPTGSEREVLECSAASSACQGAPSRPMLFNVMQDPGEHHEVSAEHPDIVARLVERVDALRSSGVALISGGSEVDLSCPPYGDMAAHVDPHVGPVWEPWCD